MTTRLLVLDNYDSFTYNLIQMFRRYDLTISVFRSDKISIEETIAQCPDYVLISPGPKNPSHAGISTELIRSQYHRFPILGVCLGMQCINEAFGGVTVRASKPVHGKSSLIHHKGSGLFAGIPSPFPAARYHSLAVSNVSGDIEITATAPDDLVMGISHRRFPIHGVQFHPESFLTEHGFRIVENFLKLGPLRSRLP